jgi:hypothetical protein
MDHFIRMMERNFIEPARRYVNLRIPEGIRGPLRMHRWLVYPDCFNEMVV